jgi:hypothetical protein
MHNYNVFLKSGSVAHFRADSFTREVADPDLLESTVRFFAGDKLVAIFLTSELIGFCQTENGHSPSK